MYLCTDKKSRQTFTLSLLFHFIFHTRARWVHGASTLPAHQSTPWGGFRLTSSSYPLSCQTTLWGGWALNSSNSWYLAILCMHQPSGYHHWGGTFKCPQGGQAAVDEGLSVVPWVSQRSRGQGRGPGVHFFLHNSSFLPMKYVKSLLGSALLDSKIKQYIYILGWWGHPRHQGTSLQECCMC